jgi:deazaflavin-dependent oxidoreductase (nitroreductase family)
MRQTEQATMPTPPDSPTPPPVHRKPSATVGWKILNGLHKGALRMTGGRWPATLRGMPAVELETVGRRTGQARTSMLTSPLHSENRVVLVASRGGADHNPSWYVNLAANPDVKVTMYGKTRPMRARTASPEEKAALWPEIVAVYKQYDGYQQRSSRDIPVVICEPLPSAPPA